ncbi:MAG: chromate efflux transporter, partial [Myxococcales bacterium]|nr:chromate efflux transporter [Myxococcales bacterium]
ASAMPMTAAHLHRAGTMQRLPLGRVARLAAWLGVAGFGGGYAVLGQIRDHLVDDWHAMTDEELAEAVAVAQSLPGASGANLFTYLGFRSGGWRGAALATTLFLLPSALLMVGFGVAYGHARDLEEVSAALAWMGPPVVAIVVAVGARLARALRQPWQIVVALVAMTAVELGIGVFEVVSLTIIAALVVDMRRRAVARPPLLSLALPLLLLLPKLALVFARLGAVSFGGGMAMVPILDHQVVGSLGWLTPREFADAVTLGQITPGPIAITSTFVGYRVAGLLGSAVATAGTFVPPFLITVAVTRSLEAFRSSPWIAATMRALAPVVVGVVGAAAISMARSSIHGLGGWLVAAGCLALLAIEAPTLIVVIVGASASGMIALW